MIFGVHTTTGGNLVGTPARAKEMTADALQIFAGSPRMWKQPTYDAATGEAFKKATDEIAMPVYAHMMYLTSYGSPDKQLRRLSINAAHQTMVNAQTIGLKGVVTHLGSHKGEGLDSVMDALCEALHEVMDGIDGPKLLLENSAGAGGNVGNGLEELEKIYESLKRPANIGFCLDTCHALAAGYEVRTEEGWNGFIKEADQRLGLDNIPVFHLNDSKTDLGSKRDRHENIGQGFIGEDGFRVILNHPDLKSKVGILEVPGIDGKGPDRPNLDKLRELYEG